MCISFFPFSFGVCCLFTTDECGATIRQNNTYVRNPGFPVSRKR